MLILKLIDLFIYLHTVIGYSMLLFLDTPVIQRMLRIGATTANTSTEKTNTSSNSSSNVTSQANADNIISTTNQTDVINTDEEMVLLFARIIGEPYCCLGPLSLLNCNVDRHPLVFHWQLRAFDTLSCGPNTHQFKRILKVSPMS